MGLGAALAMCILAYLSWKFDRDFDQFHTKKEHIFRVETIKSGNHDPYGISPIPLAEAAETQIAGVQAGIMLDSRNMVVSNGKDTDWERIFFTESDFLKYFDFPLVAGQADLDNPNSLLISERLAAKYFGLDDPVGQLLTFDPGEDGRRELTISGVLKNTPFNSSLELDFVTNYQNQTDGSGAVVATDNWAYFADVTFLVLKDPADRQRVTEYLQAFVPVQQAARQNWQAEQFRLDPLPEMAHHAEDLLANALEPSLPSSMIWGCMTMALLLLITACLNFTNMTISLAGKRLKEIGLRKVLGSSRQQLVGQLLTEGFLLSTGGLLIGLLLINQILPYYNQMWRFLDLRLVFADNLPLVFFLLAAVILTTLLAAAYPALYVSGFAPSKIFREKVQLAGSNSFSRILMGVQVAISALAIVTGISFARNADFQLHADLGYRREGIQAIFVPNAQTYQVMEQEVSSWPEVATMAGADFHIGDSAPRVPVRYRQNEEREAEWMQVGSGYLETMQIQLQQGRTFNYDLQSDYTQTALINEKLAREFFPDEDPVGQQIRLRDTLVYTVAGVVGDFMQDNFFDPTRPLVMTMARPERFQYLVVQSRAEDLPAIRSKLDQAWRSHFPDLPFEHYFQNDFIAYSIEISQNVEQMLSVLSLVTLFLTIAGLASLLSLSILKRLKEITIRRILGAGSLHIAYLVSSNFLSIVSISLIAGGVAGLWLSRKLLDSIFQIHAGVSANAVVVATTAILLMVLLTIAGRLLGAVRGNPVKYLKSE